MKNPKILIIYTGGTIGMVNDPETGALKPFDFEKLYNSVPELKQFAYDLEAHSMKNPIDSSEMNPTIWAEIAKTIFDNYESYDGFVVLHGSDTMAYTASALSFMLQGIKKPVILTGSQLPSHRGDVIFLKMNSPESWLESLKFSCQKEAFSQTNSNLF